MYASCRYKRRYADGRPRPCRSQRCPCEACRRKYAEKQAAILRRSFRERPPAYALTLRLTDNEPITARQLAGYLKKFTQKIRDFRKAEQAAFEYHINIEFSSGQPHLHMAVVTSLAWSADKLKAVVKAWWSGSCADREETAVYCDHVHNVIGLANYLPKNLKDRRSVEMPPAEWDSRACRLVWSSRGFLAKRKADLWHEQRLEWYSEPAVGRLGTHGPFLGLYVTPAQEPVEPLNVSALEPSAERAPALAPRSRSRKYSPVRLCVP